MDLARDAATARGRRFTARRGPGAVAVFANAVVAAVAIAVAATSLASSAWAQRADAAVATDSKAAPAGGVVPVEDFARRPKLARLTFSPDAKRFAALEERNGRMNIVVGETAGKELRYVTSYTSWDVGSFRWVNDDRLIFSLVDLQQGLAEQRGGGLFAVDADGRNPMTLSPTMQECINRIQLMCRGVDFLARVPGGGDDILAVSNERVAQSPDVVRLDTRSGRRTLLTTDNPGRVVHWVVDSKLVPRAALSHLGREMKYVFWFRDSADAPWRRVAEFDDFEPRFEPLGFGPDGTLYVASNLDSRDRMELFTFDAKSGRPGERLARHPGVDLGLVVDPREGRLASPLIFDPKTEALIGLRVAGDRPETVWFDERFARMQATIDAALPGAVNAMRPLDANRWFVATSSANEPGAYFLYDGDRRELREIARTRPWIRPEQMARVTPLRYRARDGLEIPAYLTLPAGREPRNLPLVVWVHGGPWARDDYGWEPEAQFFASRGYAVLQPNYRGSTGYGLKHLTASFKQLGQAMQDDVTDGVRRLVADGTVDPKRVCIGGGSYGGYATMMGLVREPQMFRCGINVVGVVDLNWWIDLGYTDFNLGDARAAEAYLMRTVGDPRADAQMMRENSPRLQAKKVQAPVLIVHGGGDRRVPVIHGETMRDALRAEGKEVEWLLLPDEGHGFMKESSRVTYYRAMESFLARNLTPR